jgi:hypothetical protein
LICVLVSQQDGLRLIVYAGLLEIFKGCFGILTPQILETVDLLE